MPTHKLQGKWAARPQGPLLWFHALTLGEFFRSVKLAASLDAAIDMQLLGLALIVNNYQHASCLSQQLARGVQQAACSRPGASLTGVGRVSMSPEANGSSWLSLTWVS